ncbi:longifolia 1-like protein, partial [Tanacetum coccineum]
MGKTSKFFKSLFGFKPSNPKRLCCSLFKSSHKQHNHDEAILADGGSVQSRPPSVVEKLMGLEALPDSAITIQKQEMGVTPISPPFCVVASKVVTLFKSSHKQHNHDEAISADRGLVLSRPPSVVAKLMGLEALPDSATTNQKQEMGVTPISPPFYAVTSKVDVSMRRVPFTLAKSESSRRCLSGYSDHPNYMSHTESSRAKASPQKPRVEPHSIPVPLFGPPDNHRVELFLVLEQTKFSNLPKQEPSNKKLLNKEKFHRKLIFDTVNEVLAKKLALVVPSLETFSSKPFKLANKTLNGQKLLRDLCMEIEELLQVKKKKDVSLYEEDDGLKTILWEKVLNRAESWTDYDGELPVIALEVERLIFKDLVNEVVLGEASHDAIPVETHVQNDTVSPEPQKSGKEYVSVSADSEFNIDSQNGKLLMLFQLKPMSKRTVQMTVFRPHSKESVSVSNKIADAVLVEIHVQNDIISPELLVCHHICVCGFPQILKGSPIARRRDVINEVSTHHNIIHP